MSSRKKYKATVSKIFKEGPHGPYVVTNCEELGSVTFSLEPNVWKEEDWPEEGITVLLSQIREKRAGWRAYHARFFEPSDKHNSSKEQRA